MRYLGVWLAVSCLLGGCAADGQADDPQVAEFRRLARAAPSTDEELEGAREYLRSLPREQQAATARVLAADEDRRISAAGIEALVSLGLERDAAPFLARRVLAGDDLTGFGWALVHGDDPSRAVRVYTAVARYLLDRHDSLQGAERERAERFISDGGAGEPLSAFSPDAARRRLEKLEAQAAKPK